ncbi:unannotated protein [freshwater metagenome]|uniref:Unannotated protein n=1 Tax=freshwater metagenome TaxID=449393 RepID=A0A6J6EIB1_9ZZZZ
MGSVTASPVNGYKTPGAISPAAVVVETSVEEDEPPPPHAARVATNTPAAVKVNIVRRRFI